MKHVIDFLSSDMLAETLLHPAEACAKLGMNQDILLGALSSMLRDKSPQYEQDIIIKHGTGTGLFLSKFEPVPQDGTLVAYLTARATFSPRNTAKTENPLVSVIMPTIFRDANLLNLALESILAQTYTNYKITVVGDGLLPSYLPLSPVVEQAVNRETIVITKTGHAGVYPPSGMERWHIAGRDPLNFGIALANSPIIARLDDDDIWLPHHLETIVEGYFKGDGNGVIYTQPCKSTGELIYVMPNSWENLSQTNVTFTCTLAFCGTAVSKLSFPYTPHEPADWAMYKQLLASGERFTKLDVVTSEHSTEGHEDGRVR